jgi:hypothetical protein
MRGLPIRRSLADPDLAFFATWCPVGIPLGPLARVEGRRWANRGHIRERQD